MAVKFPEHIQIGAHKYKVLFPYKFRDSKSEYGQHDGSLKELRIAAVDGAGNEMPDSNVAVTFFHELMHAVDEVFNARRITDGTDGEKVIACLGEGLAQIFIAGQFPIVEDDNAGGEAQT